MTKAAVVTTLRNVGPSLESFVAYHLAIGFSHIFLIFDDPADPDIARVAGEARVTAILHDEALRAAWTNLAVYSELGPFIDSEVMARQILNVAHVMGRARDQGLDWLLHIDADELFYSPTETVAEHFRHLDASRFETIAYMNYEAVSEADAIADPFRDVTLFKPPTARIEARYSFEQYAALTADIPQMPPKVFHYYNNGKSAVRLASSDMQPFGVHAFASGARAASGGTAQRQFVLHYACCGFDAFWRKYETLGRFSDAWWGSQEIVQQIGPLHTLSRDVIGGGDRQAGLAFYKERLMIGDPVTAEHLIAKGLADRITAPAQLLAEIRPRER